MGKHLFQKSTGGNQVGVSISSQKQKRRKDAVRLKTKGLLLQTPKAPDKQARTDQQHQREGDLADDQQTAQANRRWVPRKASNTSFGCIPLHWKRAKRRPLTSKFAGRHCDYECKD